MKKYFFLFLLSTVISSCTQDMVLPNSEKEQLKKENGAENVLEFIDFLSKNSRLENFVKGQHELVSHINANLNELPESSKEEFFAKNEELFRNQDDLESVLLHLSFGEKESFLHKLSENNNYLKDLLSTPEYLDQNT